MTRWAPLALAALLSGCVAYPRLHAAKKKGKAYIEEGQPLRIQGAIIRECETSRGDTVKEGRRKDTVTDAQGNYSIRVIGVAFNFRNFLSEARCASRVQLYACRAAGAACKPVDDVDLELLGK